MNDRHQKLREHAVALGELLVEKQTQYGDSVGSTGEILRQLYPDGIRPDQYDNLQLVVRVLDKLKRIASQGPDGTDRGGESPWRDVAGYGILGLAQAEMRRLALPVGVQVEYDSPRDSLCGICGFSRDAHADSMTGPICPLTTESSAQSMGSRCGHCDACATERIGCACDGAEDDGCFNCDSERHERPPCPPNVSCRGCRRAVFQTETFALCSKTNRPQLQSIVTLDEPIPSWCPGFEAKP